MTPNKYSVTLTDIETTGLNHRTDSIIQIAALKVMYSDGVWTVLEQFEIKIIPPAGFTGSFYNSYSAEAWEGKQKDIETAIHRYFNVLEGSSFGGQNPAFDHAFIDEAALRICYQWPKLAHHRKLDVSSLALPLHTQGYIDSVSQKELARFFNLGEQPHDALGDVWQSFEILRRLHAISTMGVIQLKRRLRESYPLHPMNPAQYSESQEGV